MAANPIQALAAYSNAARQATGAGLEARDQPPAGAFGDMLREFAAGAVESGQRAEAISSQALAGKADISEVVLAVNNAEVTLQTVVGIRDRLIQAYQEITRMPI